MTCIAIDARMAQSSGIGTVLREVSQRLIGANPSWRFILLGDPKSLAARGWTDVPHVQIRAFTAPIYSLREQLTFPVIACDVLWSPHYNMPLRRQGKRLVTVHDVAHLVLPEMRKSPAKQLYARSMLAQVRRAADVVVFVSEFTMSEFHRLVGTPNGRELIIPDGVDESWFDIRRKAAPDRPYILFVGNIKPYKNLSRLMDAFGRIRNEVSHDLLIVGRKEGFKTADRTVLSRIGEFEGRLHFTGEVSDEALKQIYAGADAVVLPSLYEGFGLPPVEAMAAGCPALVSRVASMPEVCLDAALYCDPTDVADIAVQLKRIVTDQALRHSLQVQGLKRARELTWTNCSKGYEAAIRSLLNLTAA